ncbi:DUF5046 domain-containing protein [Allofournierella sp.]|uniref:DUF5046 domain-containing protein n=1 Tax=Allofournierella sp. TaxID=1940256 RepID=UPI003AB4415B
MKTIRRILCPALVCALLAACAAPPGPGAAASQPPASGSAPAPAAVPAQGSVPASSYYILYAGEYSQNTVLYGEGRVLYNGPGGANFVTDAATGRIAGYAVTGHRPEGSFGGFYDLSGRQLLGCAPDALLNDWAHLQYNAVIEINSESDSLYRNLKTGETRLQGYGRPEKIAPGVYLATRPGMQPVSVLVNDELEVLRDLAPWYIFSPNEPTPGYLCASKMVWDGELGRTEDALFCIATGEILEGFQCVCGPGRACFGQGGEYVVTELSTGRQLARGPKPFVWCMGDDWAVRGPEDEFHTVQLGGRQYSCRWFTQQDGRFLLNLENDTVLLLDAQGGAIASSATLGAQNISLLPGGFYTVSHGEDGTDTALYSPDGALLARSSRYTYIYNQWRGIANNELLSGLYQASYQQGRASLCDLLGADGSPLLTGLNRIYSADEYGAAVRRGFTRGVMDYQGRWVWSESIFDSFEDEEDEPW